MPKFIVYLQETRSDVLVVEAPNKDDAGKAIVQLAENDRIIRGGTKVDRREVSVYSVLNDYRMPADVVVNPFKDTSYKVCDTEADKHTKEGESNAHK